jgi:hypothetical protein
MSRLHFLKVAILSVLHRTLSRGGTTTPSFVPPAPTTSSSEEKTVSSSTDHLRLLYSLAEVETGQNDLLVGPKGELSRFQISREVWYQHNPDLNFFLNCTDVRAEYTGLKQLWWLRKHLTEPTLRRLVYAWRNGLARTNCTLDAVIDADDYTSRVLNLYFDPTFQPQRII